MMLGSQERMLASSGCTQWHMCVRSERALLGMASEFSPAADTGGCGRPWLSKADAAFSGCDSRCSSCFSSAPRVLPALVGLLACTPEALARILHTTLCGTARGPCVLCLYNGAADIRSKDTAARMWQGTQQSAHMPLLCDCKCHNLRACACTWMQSAPCSEKLINQLSVAARVRG